MSQAATIAEVRTALTAREDQLLALLGPSIPLERFLTVALHAVNSNPELLRCSPLSIVEAIREAAALRLEPTGLLGDAYIVRYGDTARLMPGYRGLMKLARRSGEVATIGAHMVYGGDEFEIEHGDNPRVYHRPTLEAERGGYLGAYAYARLSSGELVTEWMPYAELEQVRHSSRAGDRGPWITWYAEMARKTALRRLMKRLPLATEAEAALRLEAEAEAADRPPAAKPASLAAIHERLGIDSSAGDVAVPVAAGQPSLAGVPHAGSESQSPLASTDPASNDAPPADDVPRDDPTLPDVP